MKYDESNTCCFTGHRAERLPWGADENDERAAALKRDIAETVAALYDAGVRRYICGMALGCDMYFAEAVLALKAEHPDVFFEAAVPCADQDRYWSDAQRSRYAGILARADHVEIISHRYTHTYMNERNSYMVRRSGYVLAVYGGGRGGTLNTIRMARQLGRNVLLFEV